MIIMRLLLLITLFLLVGIICCCDGRRHNSNHNNNNNNKNNNNDRIIINNTQQQQQQQQNRNSIINNNNVDDYGEYYEGQQQHQQQRNNGQVPDEYTSIDEYHRNHHLWMEQQQQEQLKQQQQQRQTLSLRRKEQQNPKRPGNAYFFLPPSSNKNKNNKNNPLWNIEDIDVGERRGPLTTTDTTSRKPQQQQSSSMSRPPPSSSSSSIAQQSKYEDDDMNNNNNNNNNVNNMRRIGAGGSSLQQSNNPQQQQHQYIPFEKRGNIFQFRPKYGKISIDLGSIGEEEEQKPIIIKKDRRIKNNDQSGGTDAVSNDSGDNNNSNNTSTTSSTSTTTATISSSTDKKNLFLVSKDSHNHNSEYNTSVSVSVSVDPASILRLSKTIGMATISVGNAFIGTLRLLAPMIVARRILAQLGYMGYDYYNGRYIRYQYNKSWNYLETYDIFSSIRSLGRFVIQYLAMDIIVCRITIWILNLSPCYMPIPALCHYWYGIVCIGLIFITSKLTELLWTTDLYPPLQIKMADTNTRGGFGRNGGGGGGGGRYFTRPWHILQWMKDPDAWIDHIARLSTPNNPNPSSSSLLSSSSSRYVPFQPDSLLFPSTWPPLHILTVLAIIRTIRRRLWLDTQQQITLSYSLPTVRMIIRKFCICWSLYEEWYRVFLREKRVALAFVVHGLLFCSIVNLIYNVALIEGIAGVLLVPTKIASIVSLWMTFVLYSERVVSSSSSSSKRRNNRRKNNDDSIPAEKRRWW